MALLYDVDLVAGGISRTRTSRSGARSVRSATNIIPEPDAGIDPLGKEVRWNNIPCEVIGIWKQAGFGAGNSLDNWIIIPLTTYNKNFGTQQDSLR